MSSTLGQHSDILSEKLILCSIATFENNGFRHNGITFSDSGTWLWLLRFLSHVASHLSTQRSSNRKRVCCCSVAEFILPWVFPEPAVSIKQHPKPIPSPALHSINPGKVSETLVFYFANRWDYGLEGGIGLSIYNFELTAYYNWSCRCISQPARWKPLAIFHMAFLSCLLFVTKKWLHLQAVGHHSLSTIMNTQRFFAATILLLSLGFFVSNISQGQHLNRAPKYVGEWAVSIWTSHQCHRFRQIQWLIAVQRSRKYMLDFTIQNPFNSDSMLNIHAGSSQRWFLARRKPHLQYQRL